MRASNDETRMHDKRFPSLLIVSHWLILIQGFALAGAGVDNGDSATDVSCKADNSIFNHIMYMLPERQW